MARKKAKGSRSRTAAKSGAKAAKRKAARPAKKSGGKARAKAARPARKKASKPVKKRSAASTSSRKRPAKKAALPKKKVVATKASAKIAKARPAAVKGVPPSSPGKTAPVAITTLPVRSEARAVASSKAASAAASTTPPVLGGLAAIAPARPAPPIKSFPAKPASRGKAAAVKSATPRRLGREMQRVGDAREATPPSSRTAFPREFLERQRQKLQTKKAEILAMYKKDLQSGQESNDSPTEDIVDRANNAYSRELAFSISDNERELIFQIDQAIGRLDGGTYGFCLHTGQAIGIARLEALPWAKYGVEAQELLEKGLLSEA